MFPGSRPEPVRISVSDVRREIYRASGFASGDGRPTTDFLGSLFHSVFRQVMDPESESSWVNALDAENLDDHARLREHVYTCIVGPRLSENQAQLQASSDEVLSLWEATGQLCKHICQLLTNSRRQNLLHYDTATQTWSGADQFSVEEPLSWLLDDPSWSAPVLVSGVADAVWRNPASRKWCVLELKLGAGSSEADLAQLCLYGEMLRSKGGSKSDPISLWHFQPELMRTELTEEQTAPVKPKLHALIGRIARVLEMRAAADPQPSYQELGHRLIQVLEQFGPMVTLESDPVVGPAFLRFHIMPGKGVKVGRILPLGEDVAVQMRLANPALIRREGSTLVVDIQRPDRETLLFREFRLLLPTSPEGNARLLVGVDLRRQPRFADLHSDTPHILAAGTTGSGKSEWLRMAIASLIATNTPETLRLMLIDPKRVTFGELEHSAFLLEGGSVLYTPEQAISGLQRLIDLMEERYLRRPTRTPLPRVVCFCDEYGNLVAEKKNRMAIESAINQLGAKARAAGIHLVVATQDPRASILSPALKSNLPGRVCLRTTSSLQSRMVLEENGAESLLGHGDLLFKAVGEPIRLQAPLLEDADRAALFGPG